MALDYAILPARLGDLLAVHALEHRCFDRDAWGWFDLFSVLVANVVRLKAVTPTKLGQGGARLVGFVVGDPRPSQGFAWIATIGVHPDFQRRGLGAALLAAAEAQLTEPRLRLTVRRSNAAAIALYEKFGYRTVTVWERYYAGGEAGLVMEKPHGAG
ncbi:MAG: GNAT family N-acetyltransferase [Anaerolineales bacterium]|nr:GNAT family N-acetyltransferase [Anaerolineales bacterium]